MEETIIPVVEETIVETPAEVVETPVVTEEVVEVKE